MMKVSERVVRLRGSEIYFVYSYFCKSLSLLYNKYKYNLNMKILAPSLTLGGVVSVTHV